VPRSDKRVTPRWWPWLVVFLCAVVFATINAALPSQIVTRNDVLDRIVGEDGDAAWIVHVRPPGLRNQNAGRLDVLWTVVDYDTGPVNGVSLITQHAIGETKDGRGHQIFGSSSIDGIGSTTDRNDPHPSTLRSSSRRSRDVYHSGSSGY